MNKLMNLAKNTALKGMRNKQGGPFGAVIVDEKGNIISKGNNKVLSKNDPTEHAEIDAIRKACKKLGTIDLSNCSIYTTAEPCPMCLSAIIWANIKTVYYGCTRKDAANIGFRDNYIYEFLKGNQTKMLKLEELDRKDCLELFKEYKENNGVIY